MTVSTEQDDVSAALTRSFLLGRLSDADQSAFEERLFVDDRVEALLRLAEFELTDDFAFDRLSDAEQVLFRQKFLVTAERQRQLEVSGALREHLAAISRARSVQKITVGDKLPGLFRFDRRARGLAFGAVLLLLLAGTVWFVLRAPDINRRFLARRSRAIPTPVATPEVTHHGSEVSSPPAHQETSPMPVHEPPVVASVALVPGKKGDVVRITVPKGERDVVRLQLTLEKNLLRTYRAELLDAAGQSLYDAQGLESIDARIDLEVPARLLKSGDYQIRLIPANERSEGARSYYFRVP